MRELCLMPWLRVTTQRTPQGVPLYPQTLHPVTILPPPAARSVPKTGQKTMKTLEKQRFFW